MTILSRILSAGSPRLQEWAERNHVKVGKVVNTAVWNGERQLYSELLEIIRPNGEPAGPEADTFILEKAIKATRAATLKGVDLPKPTNSINPRVAALWEWLTSQGSDTLRKWLLGKRGPGSSILAIMQEEMKDAGVSETLFTTASSAYDFPYAETVESFSIPKSVQFFGGNWRAVRLHANRKEDLKSRLAHQKARWESSGFEAIHDQDPRILMDERNPEIPPTEVGQLVRYSRAKLARQTPDAARYGYGGPESVGVIEDVDSNRDGVTWDVRWNYYDGDTKPERTADLQVVTPAWIKAHPHLFKAR